LRAPRGLSSQRSGPLRLLRQGCEERCPCGVQKLCFWARAKPVDEMAIREIEGGEKTGDRPGEIGDRRSKTPQGEAFRGFA
jgi:hypothetical protein